MDANTVELLKECSRGCQMAMESVKKMREYAEDPRLNSLLEAYGEKHRSLERSIKEELAKYDEEEGEPAKMAEAMAGGMMRMKMMLHPDDTQEAKIMMDGCNMGIQSVSGYLNRYPDASDRSQKLAKELIRIEEEFMQEMKGFV